MWIKIPKAAVLQVGRAEGHCWDEGRAGKQLHKGNVKSCLSKQELLLHLTLYTGETLLHFLPGLSFPRCTEVQGYTLPP